ncbi:hypothetical protein [Nonomuraea sediminis]|uniref:hypothetical protein n=1 Tax=Nonomuraea sediminis TaxID=2835864 RepID=UPI001BDC4897|nr:hypothetical protein [Nonomuraea sediminis]
MRTIIGTAAAAAAISLGALGATPAQATTATSAAAASWCVSVQHWTGKVTQTVKVTNNCNYAVSYQVKRRGPDPSCVVLQPGGSHWNQWTRYFAQWQGIRWWCA